MNQAKANIEITVTTKTNKIIKIKTHIIGPTKLMLLNFSFALNINFLQVAQKISI